MTLRKRKNECNTLRKVIPFSATDGIFQHINYVFFDYVTPLQMDTLLLSNCGQRRISPLVELFQDEPGGVIDSNRLDELGSIILSTFKWQWDKEKELLETEYEPLTDFNEETTETTTGESNETTGRNSERVKDAETGFDVQTQRTDSLKHTTDNTGTITDLQTNDLSKETKNTGNQTNTRTDNLIETRSGQNSATNNYGIFGFNSSDSVPESNDNMSGTNSGNTNNTGTQTNERTDNLTQVVDDTGTVTNTRTNDYTTELTDSGTQTYKKTGTESYDDKTTYKEDGKKDSDMSIVRTISRKGKQNKSSQDLFQEQLKVLQHNFLMRVIADVKGLLTIPVYV